jgi:hypothetical protein
VFGRQIAVYETRLVQLAQTRNQLEREVDDCLLAKWTTQNTRERFTFDFIENRVRSVVRCTNLQYARQTSAREACELKHVLLERLRTLSCRRSIARQLHRAAAPVMQCTENDATLASAKFFQQRDLWYPRLHCVPPDGTHNTESGTIVIAVARQCGKYSDNE